jgi:hypothetical protein
VYHCALKIPKIFFKYFLQGRPTTFYTAFVKPPEGQGLYVNTGSQVARGSWRWGCEEWLGLKGPKLGWRMRCKQGTKNPELLHPGLP